MEQEILHQIGQVTDMLSQLKEPISRTSPTELDAEAQNAIFGLFQEVVTFHTMAFQPRPAPPPESYSLMSASPYSLMSASPFGSSVVQQGIQTTCPKCGQEITVILK